MLSQYKGIKIQLKLDVNNLLSSGLQVLILELEYCQPQ